MLVTTLCSCTKDTSDSEEGPVFVMPFDNETSEFASIAILKIPEFVAPSREEDPDGIIVAIWKNGNAIWSEDDMNGGTPYFKGTIGKAGFDKIINDLLKSGFFKISRDLYHVFDASYITITVVYDDNFRELISCHELFEQNENLVASDHGIESLEGRDRNKVIEGGSSEYREFRKTWKQARTIIKSSIPDSGEKLEKGVIELKQIKPKQRLQRDRGQ